jgi:ribbon-helix-helix CopG family protein
MNSRNEDIKPLAKFEDRAVPLNATAIEIQSLTSHRSVNEEIRPFARFEDKAQIMEGDKSHQVTASLSDDMLARLSKLAAKNQRSTEAELCIAIEEHLNKNAPPITQ